MKLVRFNDLNEPPAAARLGAVLQDGLVADLKAGGAKYFSEVRQDGQARELAALRFRPHIADFLNIGPPGWTALDETCSWLDDLARKEPNAIGLDGQRLFTPLKSCRLHATVRPAKVIIVSGNYSQRDDIAKSDSPTCWLKATTSVIGPGRKIEKPTNVETLRGQAQLAVVIGKKCRNVPINSALDVVAGYTVLCNVLAPELITEEQKSGGNLVGSMLDATTPMGPWLSTPDEIPRPTKLRVSARVNGELRQEGSTADMPWTVEQLIAYASRLTLEPGDVIAASPTSKTRGAAGDKPDGFYIKVGDVIECEISGIGILRNEVANCSG